MQRMSTTRKSSGFTLIEVVLIAPIIILLIGAFIALIVNLTGESLVLREKNATLYDTQNALDDIEHTVNRSASFVETTPAMVAPQGTGASKLGVFNARNTGEADALILLSPSTTQNPYSPDRNLISLGAGACDASKALHYSYIIYFVSSSNALTKRTIVPLSDPLCATPWQRNSCAIGDMTVARCAAEDEVLVEGVANTTAGFGVTYYQQNGIDLSGIDLARKANVSISASRQVAGETTTASGSLQATRITARPFSASAPLPATN